MCMVKKAFGPKPSFKLVRDIIGKLNAFGEYNISFEFMSIDVSSSCIYFSSLETYLYKCVVCEKYLFEGY